MVSHRVNSDGLPQYHLRRIGRRPSLPDVANFIDFKKRVTLIGRNREVVDYILISANESCNRSISRIHARVIRALPSNRHRLVDSSCTGVYFNDRWLAGDVILSEGDTVTFGHPQSSRLDRGERIRQPNSEFHFMFELCDCELGQGTEQGQGPRPCTTPLMQTPLILPAACPRFPTPALLLGAVSGLMPGQLSPMGDTGGMMALHDLGKPTAVTEVREHGVQWLSFAHCGPERMELANQGHDSADPDAPLPVTLAQPSLVPISVTGDNPIASGSRAGVHLDSQTQGRGLFPPVILAVWNEHLNEPTVSGDGESSRRQLPDSHKRLSSGEAGQLLSEGWEARASPYGQGGGAGAKRHCTSLSMSRCCREGSRHEGEASLPADASILQEGICTSPLSCPNIVQGGSSFRSAQDEIQGKMQGATMNIAHSSGEPAVGMGWAVPINKALPDDTSRIDAALPDDTDVSKATGAADPRLDPDTTGQFNLCQGEDTLTEFTVQDTQELESSGSSIGEACRDSVSSVCQTGENELHVHNEDCHLQPSKGRDLVMGSISFYKAAQGQDSPTRSIVENTSATDTPAPLRKRQHDAMRNSPEDTHVQRYSTPNKSPRAQTPESSGNLGKKLKVICLSRVVPGQDLLLEGRLATAYVGNKKSGGLPGDPQRLLADPAWAEEELPLSTAAVSPITVDAEFTALNGESVDASLDGDHLVEAQATADMIGDYTRPAGRSVCENGDQHLSDHFHGCTIVGDKQETINIPALWTQAHNSLPKAVSGLLTKQMEKDGNLINSETPEGLGFMVESQVAHKQKAVSVGRSQCIKPAENGMSSVQSPATVSDTLWAKFTTLDGCVPKADSSTCVAEAKPESKMAVEMAGVKSNFPMNSLSTFGSSNEGAKNGDDQWVMPTMKLCSSLVGSGLIDLEGAQEHVSTVGQPMEGHCVCATDQRGLETGVSGTEKGVSGMEMVVSGELEAGVSGELEMGVSGELETGVSGMETSVSGELETGVSGELETGMSGVETGVSGELEMGVSGELKTGVSGVETGVSGELEMGVSGELEMGVSGELEKGVSGMEMGVSGELETGVSGELEMGVSGMEIGVSEELKMGVSGMEMGVSGMETGVSGMETGVSGKLETSVSGELEASVSGELETGVSGLLETGVSGELETGVSGELKTGVSGKLETDVSGELETGVSGELETGVSGMKTGVSGELKTGVSGELETGVSGDLKTGVSGDLKTGVSGELETGVSGELETGLSGELETGVSGELETGVSGKLEMSVSGELETGVSGELETGVSGMETGVSEELETGVSGKLEMSVSGELETGVLGDLKTGVSGELETGVSGELETGVSGMETGVSGELETGVSGKLEMSVSGELEMGVSGELETGVSGMETGVSGELETGVSGKLEMSVSGELETGVSGELETGVSGMETGVSEELEIGVSGKLEMSVSGELETGVSGELETGVSGELKTGVSVELKTGVLGELETGVSGDLKTGVSGELETGVLGELETGVSGELETGLSGELETGVSGELETGVSGELETGVSGMEMGVSGELKTGVSGELETGVSGELETGVSGELEMGVSGELEMGVSGMEMGVSGELETGVSGELETGVSGVETGVSGELETGVSGELETGVSGELETGVSGELETGVSGELQTGVSGMETGVSGELEMGVSGMETGVSGELETGVSGELETGLSGELETGVSGELQTGLSGMETGVSGELAMGVSGMETGVSGELEMGVSGELEMGVSVELKTGVLGELETGVSGELETGVSGELKTGVSGELKMGVSVELKTGVSGELETGVSGELETGVSGELETGVSGELETGVSGELETGVSGELETGVSGELKTGVSGMETGVSGELETGLSGMETGVSGELETGVSWELETGVSGELETGVSGELETGVSGELETGVSGELETGVSGELETGVSGMETGVSGELEMGVSGELETGVSGELETGVSGELETGVSGELETGVSGELETGVSGELETGVSGELEMGVSGELKTGVSGELKTGVSGMETGVSGELETGLSGMETGVSGELKTGVSWELETGVSGELETGVSGELETGVSGELETGVSGELAMGVSGMETGVSGMETGVSGELETGVSGELETGVSVELKTGVSGELETGVSGELETGVSGELKTGVSGELKTGVSGELETGVSGELETGVSVELKTGVSGELETGVSGELETGVSGELETGVSGELETGVSGELETGVSGMETGVSGELEMGVSGMETGVSGELEMGVSGMEMGVSGLETGVSGLEMGVSRMETGASGVEMGVSGIESGVETGVSGMETGVSGELETGVSGMETGVSGELETGVSGMETGVSQVPDKCEQSDDLRRDSGLLPLEQIMCQNIVMESEIATLGRVERVCDIGIGVTHVSVKQCGPYGAEGDSDSKDASVTLDLSPKSDAEELGDPTKMDKSVEVDPVPECTGGKMDVINLHPKAVARNVPSTDVEATASSTILECDVINKPKLPEPSAAVSADTEMQQEVSRRGRVDAHSELEQTESLAMAPWLSACVEPESHRGEDGGVLPECSALTVTFHTSGVQVCEAVDLLMPAGDPVAALVKLNATVAPDSVAGVPPWCVSLPSSATASSPTQTERPSQAGTEMAGEQRCSEHLALEQPACGVPSSVTVGLEGDGSLRYLVGPPGSQNVLRQGEDSGPSLTEVHPTGQNVEGNPPLVPEDREGVNKLESEPAKERYLVSQNLATRTVPGATAVLGGHREDFTVTGKMELDSNSMEDGAKFYPCKDCEQGASSLMETSKYEATEGVNQELCLVQWMHPGVLGMSDTERFSLSSAPLEGCGQGKEAKTAGSPLTALGKVPTGWRTAANTPTSLGLTVTEGGTDTTVPHSPASEGGTDTPTSLGLPVSEGGTDTPTSLGLPVPEGGTDTPMSLGLTVPEGGTDTTVPHSPASEGGTDTPTSLGLTVPEGGTGTPMLLGLPVPEGGTDTTVPHSPASEGGTDTPMSLGLTVPEGGADTTVPHSPVPEGGTDITAPWGPVPEGRTDITAPRGHSVHEGGTDITAPGVRTDITAPRGHSVPEGETDITAQGVQTDITAPGGHSVHEGGTDITAQGVRTDITAPGGHSVPEGGTDITAPGGHSVHEGDAKSQGSVDIRDKGFGKETLVAACYGGGSGFQQNQALLGAAVFAVTTVAEQRMMMQASGTDAEWDDDIISDEWLLSSEKQLPMDATPTGELSGAEEHQPSLSEDGACLMAGYRNQLKQSTASAEEANRAAVNKSPTSRNSQYPSGCIEVLSSAGLVGGQPPNRQRAELQEEAVQTTSWGAEKDEGRPGESVPGLSDAAVRHLVYHSSLQGGDRLEALSSSGPGQVDASPGMEQAEGKQSGSGHGSKQRSVGSNELSARVDSSDLSAAGFALKTELRCSCPGDPNAQEERVVRSSFAIAVQEAGDAGSICKTSGAGEKPGGSEDQELVGERHGKSKEPPAPEWKSRPSPVQAPQLPRIWTASLQEEPPRASPVFDNQQPQIRACSKAVPPLALVKPHALEDERLDGQKGEGLDERTNLVSEAMLSVGLRLPHEMGQEVDKDSTESDDSLADLAEAWSMGWILGNQVPDKSKNEATSSEQGDGLSMRADGFGPSTESSLPVSYNQIVTEIVISSITNPATGAGVDLSQTLAALGPNGQDLATKELLLDPCPQTQCSEVMSVPVEESSEDLQLEDRRPEENCDSSPPALPRDSDLLERPRFSKQAEVDPRCIAEEGNARESGGGEEFGTKSEMGRGATEETLGKKEVCVLSHIASYILKEGIGTIDTPMHCSHLSNNSRGTDKNLQQRPIVENPNEDPLEKCRSPNAVGQPRTESVDVCVFEQDSQEGKVIQPSEGKESSLPEVPLAEVSWGKPMAASVDSDVELETAEVSHQDLSGKKVENDNKVNLGLGADSTNIQLSLECLNVQPSESKSEEEDGAGSWRSNGLSHSGIRALKRPRASEVADSNSRATGPSKRSRTHQQIRGVGLRAAEGIKLSLQSFSKQLRQVRANYIGRLVQQFFTEYTPPWKRRVPKFVVVNRKDEVARIVKEFFEALSIQSKAKAVDKSQQSVKPIASQQPTCTVSELGQEPREGDESSQLEVYQKQEAQLESPCLIGRGLARTRGSGGASFLKEAGPSLTVDCPSSETSWRDRVGGDSEICPLQEGSGVAEESDTMQERSWHTKSEIISSSTHLGQISSAVVPGDIQDPATEDFGLSFCFTQDERVSAEKAEAFSACEMGPLLLPQCSSIAESPEQPGDDRCGENQSLGQKDTSCDGGTEEMACGGREPLSLEMPNSPLNPCGSALVECVEEGRTDERSSSSPAHLPADLAVDDDVTGVFQDGRSSSDSSTHSPALILDIHPPDLAEFSQIQEVPCHPGHNQDQCYKDVNVQPSALGFRKLLQTNSMDGLNVAQMACSNDEIKPNNASFDSSSNNKVEPINAMEPSVLHHKIVGQNDGNIGLKIAEPSALHSNGVAHGDNGVEPVNEEQLLIGQNNLSYSSTELECAKQSALAYGDLDHNDKGTNSVNSAEPSALAHNTSTSLTGGESAAPLGHCTEQQSSPSRLLEAETALQAAPSDRLELGQSLGGRRLWELPVPLRPDQRGDFGGKAGVMGCRSSGHSAREHQSRLAEPFRLPASQLSGREVKNLEGMASWNAVAKDPTRSERWESVGRFKSTEKPYLEMPRAAGAHRSRFNIDWRAHGEIFPGSQVAAETAGESLPASGVSSVPFAEDVKMEIGCAPADGVDFSSPDPFLPVGMPRARDCPEMLAKHRDMNPLLTDPRSAPRPAMSEQPAHQVVEGTRPDAGVAKEIGPRGWHSSPDCPSMAGCQQPASKSLLLSSSRGIGESGARVGYIGCERVGRENELRLKANNEENGSDREAGECACGQWSRATTPLAQPGCLPAASGVGNCLIAPTTSFAQPSRAPPSSNHNPSLPEDAPGATSWRSLEWNAVPSPLENPGVRFAALRNSTSTPTEALHPQPTQSSSAQPRCKSEPNLLSDTREQSFPVLSQDPPFHSDSQAFRLPNEPLSCGFGNKVPLPTAAEERVLYSKGILDQECSRDYTSSFCGLSSSSLGSDSDFSKGSHRPRHGEGNGGTRTQLYPSPSECDPCSSRNPARSEAIVRTRYRSAETVEGLQRSLLPEHQGEKGMETCKPCAPSARFLLPSPEHRWASSEQVIQSQLRECRLLLQHISEALQAEGVAEEHVAEWREQIKEMEKQTVAPLTYIAVVGDTGSGKSSLLNALLDEEGVLPTSAMRACTAVVVEVSLNTNSDHYTADVEFFSEEEWNKELLSLLSDMTDKSGRLRRRRPDPGSEASMAYSRVKAVYGKILLYQELKQFREVTQYLGTTTTIREMQASKFRSKVQRFIDTRNNDYSSSRGGEFWPIVKRVHIQVPKSAVLQTGAVLVDLPGVRDSNDARNSVAKEYLKTCDAVWIVANVTRAVDDKTAKETLDESLRRQLLMDGHFGCIAFICTKTDSHNVTEIMSALSLTDECSPLEERIAKLRKEIEQRQIDHKAWTSELERARGSNQNGERAKQLELAIKQLKVNLTELHSEVSVKQSELSLNSIRARNFFCKQKICLNFKRGLQDLKCQARAEDTDSDEEQEESDDDGDDDDEVPPSTADPRLESQLPVFTVSSTEYLKLRDKLQRDGPPRVFHNIEDTEIPAVQKFVHQITLARQALGAEVVIRKLATFVSHIVNYLTNRRAQNANYQAKVREALQDCLSRVREIFQQTAEDCRRDIENSFATIKMHLNMGKKKAMKSCEDTVLRWGSRPPIGYPYTTYKATCSRNGIFSSPACGSIDFNEELSRPLLTNLQVIWNQVFSMSVPQHLTRFKADVLGKLEYFFNNLLQRLKWIEGDTQPVNYILHQQLNAVRAKLENFALKLLDDITARQRSISRILTPAVQSGMMPTYLKSASESGPGCFMQMKSCMEQHMRFQKEQLFTNACRKLGDQLDILKQEIHSRLKLFLDEICNELLVQFEPLLKPLKIIDEIIPKLVSICRRTTAVCQRSHIDFTLPKIEENDEELEPATFLRKPLGSGTPPLQELKKFLGKVKIMQINQVEVTPTDPVEISLDKLLLKYKVPDTQILCEQPVPFQCLSVCEFCTSIPFLILTYKEKCKSKERTDVVLLDEEQAVFGQWMEAVAERWQGRLEFRCLEVVQGVERLRSLRVIYQGSDTKVPNEEKEEPCVWPRSNDDSSSSSSSSSSCVFVDIFPQSRKRQWGEMDPPGALPVPQGPSHWGQSSWINVETQTQPPRLKKERRDRPGSSHSQDWEYRLKPPVMKKEFCDSPADDDFDNL